MTPQLLLLTALLLCFFFMSLLYIRFNDERNYNLYLQGKLNPYKRKKLFLTVPEQELFSILQSANTKGNFLIFPQLHLSTLLAAKDETSDLKGKFDWLNTLYVDFVLFDKDSLQPILVIELNDSTHFWSSRKARDQFVKKALEENGIPLFTIDTPSLTDKEQIITSVLNRLNS